MNECIKKNILKIPKIEQNYVLDTHFLFNYKSYIYLGLIKGKVRNILIINI